MWSDLSAFWALGWQPEPTAIAGVILLTLGYLLAVGPLRQRLGGDRTPSAGQQAGFHLGTLVVLLALVSPLDVLGDQYLFSAHMVQHLLFLLVAGPLWLQGIPPWLMGWIVPAGWPRRALRAATRPLVAFLLYSGVMWIWHLPGLYNAALENESLHAFEHLSFLAASVIGWWPVLGQLPRDAPRASTLTQMVYLFLLGFPCTALSALLVFAHQPLYSFYLTVPRIWGTSALGDQVLGGVLMWVPSHMVYLTALSIVFFRWLEETSAQSRGLPVGGVHTR
ncbi:MAG: cytochrome c oxidase assembly protein [Anaerolineales bacterium]|jgi:putative membrane protein